MNLKMTLHHVFLYLCGYVHMCNMVVCACACMCY